jgi:hypothetical protein
MTTILEKKVGDVAVWQLYVGFVILQIIIGIVVALLIGVFDLANIHGVAREIILQVGRVANARSFSSYADPIGSEIREGKII